MYLHYFEKIFNFTWELFQVICELLEKCIYSKHTYKFRTKFRYIATLTITAITYSGKKELSKLGHEIQDP